MKSFAQIAFFLASVASVAAKNMVYFQSLDNTTRTVYFTASPGSANLDSITVGGGEEVPQEFPHGWQGNWYAVQDGAENKPGMLGEVLFNGWRDMLYYDVSAIVDPNDMDNVRELYPKGAYTPTSGCESFPCNNCYYLPDDVQTKVTQETELICTLGANGLTGLSGHNDHNDHSDSSKREEHPAVSRNYVMGKF